MFQGLDDAWESMGKAKVEVFIEVMEILMTIANKIHVHNYIPRRKSGIYWIQVCRAAAAAAVEISLWTR